MAFRSLKEKRGKLIAVSGDSSLVIPEQNITIQQIGHHPDTNQKVAQLVKAMATGKIQMVTEKEYEFEQAPESLKKTETRHARGKLIVKALHEK